MSSIYQKKAVERLESPDQLDRLIAATPPMTWMVIAGFALMLAAFLAWAFWGTIRQTVTVNAVALREDMALAYVPVDAIGEMDSGNACSLKVTVGSHAGLDFKGSVSRIENQVADREAMADVLRNESIVLYLQQEAPACAVYISLAEGVTLAPYELLEACITVSERSPYQLAEF